MVVLGCIVLPVLLGCGLNCVPGRTKFLFFVVLDCVAVVVEAIPRTRTPGK